MDTKCIHFAMGERPAHASGYQMGSAVPRAPGNSHFVSDLRVQLSTDGLSIGSDCVTEFTRRFARREVSMTYNR
jgi:hypothetical protein